MILLGIEQTTDRRARETKIVRIATPARARRWLAMAPTGFAFPGAADPTLPVSGQNFHKRFREVYEMPPRWRVTKAAVDRLWEAQGGSYSSRRPWIDIKASLIAREATRRIGHGDD